MDTKKQILNCLEELIEREAQYTLVLSLNEITQLKKGFSFSIDHPHYPKNSLDSFAIVSTFFKKNYPKYYDMIQDGIEKGSIRISHDIATMKKSCFDFITMTSYILLQENDGDLFLLVHELGHFIDVNLSPTLVPYEKNYLCETIAFYMEKKLQSYLLSLDKRYQDLIDMRILARLYFEKRFLKRIDHLLFYINLYQKHGFIPNEYYDEKKIQPLLTKNYDHLIDYYLRYPLGNLYSTYLINHEMPLTRESINYLPTIPFQELMNCLQEELPLIKVKKKD